MYSPNPSNSENGVPCTFTLDESALSWQPEAGIALGCRDGMFLLFNIVEITHTVLDTFTLTHDSEQYTMRAGPEGKCTSWLNVMSHVICEARDDCGSEENEEEASMEGRYQEKKKSIDDTQYRLLFNEHQNSLAAAERTLQPFLMSALQLIHCAGPNEEEASTNTG